MTKKELIEELSKFADDTEVLVGSKDDGCYGIRDVRVARVSMDGYEINEIDFDFDAAALCIVIDPDV